MKTIDSVIAPRCGTAKRRLCACDTARTGRDRGRHGRKRPASPIPSLATASATKTARGAGDGDERLLARAALVRGITGDHEVREPVHQRRRPRADGKRACAPAPPRGHHSQPIPPASRSSCRANQAKLPDRLTRPLLALRHQAEERVFQARAALPACRRNSSKVPCAISRPSGDDADAVGHALRDFEDMGRHDDGAAGVRRARAARS